MDNKNSLGSMFGQLVLAFVLLLGCVLAAWTVSLMVLGVVCAPSLVMAIVCFVVVGLGSSMVHSHSA